MRDAMMSRPACVLVQPITPSATRRMRSTKLSPPGGASCAGASQKRWLDAEPWCRAACAHSADVLIGHALPVAETLLDEGGLDGRFRRCRAVQAGVNRGGGRLRAAQRRRQPDRVLGHARGEGREGSGVRGVARHIALAVDAALGIDDRRMADPPPARRDRHVVLKSRSAMRRKTAGSRSLRAAGQRPARRQCSRRAGGAQAQPTTAAACGGTSDREQAPDRPERRTTISAPSAPASTTRSRSGWPAESPSPSGRAGGRQHIRAGRTAREPAARRSAARGLDRAPARTGRRRAARERRTAP